MDDLFRDLQQGLTEAIAFASGEGKATIYRYAIQPVQVFSNEEIRRVRMKAHMTQTVFAKYMGVSVKTVEAWEKGRTRPTGPACRLIAILSNGQQLPFVEIVNETH